MYNSVINSSVRILAESFQVNETYQFLVQMVHRHDLTHRSIGYLVVEIEDTQSPMIMIRFLFASFKGLYFDDWFSCAISGMCLSRTQFHYVNPTTQLALFSRCFGHCSPIEKIHWKIYQGSILSTNQIPLWTLVPSLSSTSFYGNSSSNWKINKDSF